MSAAIPTTTGTTAPVAEILDADPSLHDGDRLRLPFVVDAYRAVRNGP